MSCSLPGQAGYPKDAGRGGPGWGRSDTGHPLPPALPSPGTDTRVAHIAVGRGWGLWAEQWQLPCPLYLPGHWASSPDLFLPLHSQRLRQNYSRAGGVAQASPQLPGRGPPTNGRASAGPASQRQLFLGSPGPMVLPPIPFVPPLTCARCREGDLGPKGWG